MTASTLTVITIVGLQSGCSQFTVADNDKRPVQHGHGQKFMVILLMAHLAIAIAGSLLCCCLRVTIAIAIVGLRSGCSCCCGDLVALGGKDATVTKMLIEDVLTLLLLIKDCCRSAFFVISMLLSVCHDCHCHHHYHCWIVFRLHSEGRTPR